MRRKEIGKKMLIWTLSASMLAAPVLSSVSVYAEEYIGDQSNLNDSAKGAVEKAAEAIESAEGAEKAGGTAATEADEAKKAAEIAEALAEKAILIYNEEEGKKVDVAGGAVTEAAGKVTTAQNAANQDQTDTETAASKAQNDAVEVVKKADKAMAAVYEDLGNKTIDKALTDAETAFGNATGDITDGKTTAEGKLTEIEDAIAAGTTDKRGMQALAGEADAAAQKAEGALTDAQDAVKATKDAYDKALKIAEDAQKELDKLLRDYETLAGQKDGDIATQKKAAEDAIKAAQGVLDKAEEDLKKAKDAYDASMKGLETATKDAEDAKAAANLAKAAADTAIDDLAILTSGRKYETLVNDKKTANDALETAKSDKVSVDAAQDGIIAAANAEIGVQNGYIQTATGNITTLNNEINAIKNSDAYRSYEKTIYEGNHTEILGVSVPYDTIGEMREVATKTTNDVRYKITKYIKVYYKQSDIDAAKAYVQAYDAAVAAKAVLDGQISAKNTEISNNQTTINNANQAIAYQNNTVIAGANAAKKAAADNVTEKQNAYDELTDLVKGVDDCFFTADETFTYELTVEEQAAFKQYISKAAESTGEFNTVNSDATKYKNATEDESFINLLKDYRNALKDTNLVDFVVRTLALKDSIDKAYERFEIVGDYHEYISLDGAYYTFDVVNGDKENISYFVALTSDKCIVKTINDTQKAVYAATFANEKAKKAESAAAQAKLDEAAALAKYTAALKAVEDAKKALNKIKFQDVTVEKKIELKATLANAKSVCSQAKEKYETSAKTAEELEETAGAARKAADKAKELADAIIVPAVANGTSAAPSFDEDDDVVLVGGRTVTNPQGTTNNGGGAVVTSSVRQGIAAGVANAANAVNTANGGVALADNQIPLADGNAILGSNANKTNNNKKELKKLSPNDVPLAANVDFEDEQFSLVWLLAALAAAALIGFGTYKYQMSRKESAK